MSRDVALGESALREGAAQAPATWALPGLDVHALIQSDVIVQVFPFSKKGVFTRDRQPKAAAHYLRQRWTSPAD